LRSRKEILAMGGPKAKRTVKDEFGQKSAKKAKSDLAPIPAEFLDESFIVQFKLWMWLGSMNVVSIPSILPAPYKYNII
jgi:hypothetical protein